MTRKLKLAQSKTIKEAANRIREHLLLHRELTATDAERLGVTDRLAPALDTLRRDGWLLQERLRRCNEAGKVRPVWTLLDQKLFEEGDAP